MTTASLLIMLVVSAIVCVKFILPVWKKQQQSKMINFWANKVRNSEVNEFPMLEVTPMNPIKNAKYYFDGRVASIAKHEKWVAEKFGQSFSMETNDKTAAGRCIHYELTNSVEKLTVCVVFVRQDLSEVDYVYTASHEEFHVAQFLDAKEVFDSISQRFLDRGFRINWNEFDFEQQASLAGILVLWECGLPMDETLVALGHNSNTISTFEKLLECEFS